MAAKNYTKLSLFALRFSESCHKARSSVSIANSINTHAVGSAAVLTYLECMIDPKYR